jgi:hypothetical protein
VTRRHDSRAQLRRRHTLAVAVTVAGTYANATLREAVALPRSSCGPFVQLAARGRVTHVISSHRMRLLPDAIRRQWPCCSRVDGSEWSDVKKTKSVTRPKSAEGGPRVRPTRPRRCACTCAAGGPSSGTYRETLLSPARGRDQIRPHALDCRGGGGGGPGAGGRVVLSLHARVSDHVSGPCCSSLTMGI